jgi:outer membrane protein TolC
LRATRNTGPALEAARATERQAAARYQAGLATTLDVADAQRVLAQAELEDVTARLEVRRAMLLLSRATGDLEPFVLEARGGALPTSTPAPASVPAPAPASVPGGGR